MNAKLNGIKTWDNNNLNNWRDAVLKDLNRVSSSLDSHKHKMFRLEILGETRRLKLEEIELRLTQMRYDAILEEFKIVNAEFWSRKI